MARRTKIDSDYNILILGTLIDWIQDCGDVDLALKNVGVDRRKFDKWYREKPDFKLQVQTALQIFRDNLPVAQRARAKKALAEYLSGSREKVSIEEDTLFSPDGKIRNRRVIKKTEVEDVPRWAIERALGGEMEELTALKVLARNGWIDTEEIDLISERLNVASEDIKAILKNGKKNDQNQ